MSLNDNIYVYCPRCNELNLQKRNEYPIVCCGIAGMTFGKGECCLCHVPLPVDPETLDICITCQMSSLTIR